MIKIGQGSMRSIKYINQNKILNYFTNFHLQNFGTQQLFSQLEYFLEILSRPIK